MYFNVQHYNINIVTLINIKKLLQDVLDVGTCSNFIPRSLYSGVFLLWTLNILLLSWEVQIGEVAPHFVSVHDAKLSRALPSGPLLGNSVW